MSSRHTWLWFVLAAGLFAFIFFFQRHQRAPQPGLGKVLPELRAAAVTSVQVRPSGPVSLGIRAERTNNTWQLVEPLLFLAQRARIEKLLQALDALTPTTYITPAELRSRSRADEEFGFTAAQASIILQQGGYRAHLIIGSLTPPGDQVYVQVVGHGGVYVVDAALLQCLPRSANEWRDPTLVGPRVAQADRLAVTNNARAFVLQRDTNRLWRMVWPLNSARADNTRIEEALQSLAQLRIDEFVSDDPKPDLEAVGLARPDLELALGQGTNAAEVLQFGKTVATATNQVYARRLGQTAIFTVARSALALWRGASVNDFRDPHLLTLTKPVAAIEARNPEPFSLQRQTNGAWLVLPDNIPADKNLVDEFLSALTSMQVVQFAKDVVNAPELPEFGLASPARQYLLKAGSTSASGAAQPDIIVELDFGLATNAPDRVFVRRTDESSVYAVSTNDFARLPSAGWRLRERRLWEITENEVARLVIQQQDKTRELIRKGPHQWSLAPGSQGIINDLAVEETVRGLAQASAVSWVARGDAAGARYGLTNQAHRITLQLKNGDKLSVAFGGLAPSGSQYASVVAAGETYILEFPWVLYRDIASYLSIP